MTAQQNKSALTILRLKKVEERIGLKHSAIYDRVKKGTFPPPISIGAGSAVGWIEAEIDSWVELQIKQSRSGRNGA